MSHSNPPPCTTASLKACLIALGLAGGGGVLLLGLWARTSGNLWIGLGSFVLFWLTGMVGWFCRRQGHGRTVWGMLTGTLLLAGVAIWHQAPLMQHGLMTGFRFEPWTGWYPVVRKLPADLASASWTDWVTTDDRGLRNPRFAEAPPKALEVVVQGDSNLFGYMLKNEETFCAAYQRAGGGVCYNAGVNGFDVHHYYFQNKYLLDDLEAQARLIVFNLGNDFSASILDSPYLVLRPYLLTDDQGGIREVPLPHHFVPSQFYGYRYLPPYAQYDREIRGFDKGRGWGRLIPDGLSHNRVALFLLRELGGGGQSLLYPPRGTEDWKNLAPYYGDWLMLPKEHWPEPYRRFARELFPAVLRATTASTRTGRVHLLLFPMPAMVVPQAMDEAHARFRQRGQADLFSPLALNDYLRDMAHELDIPVLDATPYFRAHPTPQSLFQTGDEHLSVEGMALVAELAAEWLKRGTPRPLVPASAP